MLRTLPSAGQWSIPRWRVIDMLLLSWFCRMSIGTVSSLLQLSFAVERRGHQYPSTLGPFHIATFNRIRKSTGSQKLADLKPFLPKTLNTGDASEAGDKVTGSKKASSSRGKRDDNAGNPLTVFLKELSVTREDWDTVRGAMNSMAKGKISRASRQVGNGEVSLSTRACTFWVRSRDILGNEKVLSNSDKLTALAYTFIVSHAVHYPMITPELPENEQWLWDAWNCRATFEQVICQVFQCDDGDWIWADHIPLPNEVYERPDDAPLLEAYYEKQMKVYGSATLENIEKLSLSARAIVNAAGRFKLNTVPADVREKVTTLTNEYVAVSLVLV
jgi:hypothetical protein